MAEGGDTQRGILFATPDLLVRRVAHGAGGPCFVTFDSFTDRHTLDRPGFGEQYFAGRRVDAIHLLTRTNRWYQHAELPDALAAVRAATAGCPRVIAYGSSMGGYAALTYGAACGAQAGLALSPQYSIDRRVVPFEWRWAEEARATRFRPDPAAPLPWQAIVFDPREAEDAAHAALFAARSPTALVRAAHAGHPVGAYLLDVGAFAPLLESVAAGRLDVPALERMLRDGRRRSAQYWFSLSRRLGRHHAAARVSLARGAVALRPDDAALVSHLAAMLDEAGADPAEARALHEAADRLPSASRHTRFSLVLHHERTGAADEAWALLGRLLAEPAPPGPFVRARARLLARRWAATGAGRLLARLGLARLLDRAARLAAARRPRALTLLGLRGRRGG